MLCEQLALEVQQLGRVPLRSRAGSRNDEDTLRKRIESAKEDVPFFADDWGRSVFDHLKAEIEHLRSKQEQYWDLRTQIECLKENDSITDEQYCSAMSELHSV